MFPEIYHRVKLKTRRGQHPNLLQNKSASSLIHSRTGSMMGSRVGSMIHSRAGSMIHSPETSQIF